MPSRGCCRFPKRPFCFGCERQTFSRSPFLSYPKSGRFTPLSPPDPATALVTPTSYHRLRLANDQDQAVSRRPARSAALPVAFA